MDREDIIRMAREAGLAYGSDERPLGSVTRFAALVAAAERDRMCEQSGISKELAHEKAKSHETN
jgi:hypothetical protein